MMRAVDKLVTPNEKACLSVSRRRPCLSERGDPLESEEQYDLETNDNGCEEMRTRREKIASKIWGHEWLAKRTLFTDDPEVSTDPLEAQFLIALSTMKEPCLTLEIGMFTRCGAAAMLMDSDYATLVSTVIDPFLKPWVQECLTSMPNILSQERGRAHSGHTRDDALLRSV